MIFDTSSAPVLCTGGLKSVPVKLDVSGNGLTKVPLSTFSPSSSANVQELLLRSNKISKLPSYESFSRFSGLRHLDLSDNKLTELGNSFSSLPCLTKLSLSYNRIRFDVNDWRSQERSLKHLDLSNTSLSYVPALPLPSLLTLKLSYNGIAYIPPDLQTNLTDLKMLDVSHNILTEMTPFPQLVFLNIAANPINTIANSTFLYFSNLADLDICQLPLSFFDIDSLGQLDLMTLAISEYDQVDRFNVPLWIRDNVALRHLIYEASFKICIRRMDMGTWLGNANKTHWVQPDTTSTNHNGSILTKLYGIMVIVQKEIGSKSEYKKISTYFLQGSNSLSTNYGVGVLTATPWQHWYLIVNKPWDENAGSDRYAPLASRKLDYIYYERRITDVNEIQSILVDDSEDEPEEWEVLTRTPRNGNVKRPTKTRLPQANSKTSNSLMSKATVESS
ncbi:unnamed protein product, partial [Nesidiocoris tenuis]